MGASRGEKQPLAIGIGCHCACNGPNGGTLLYMAPSGAGLLVLRLLGMPVCAALAAVSNKRVHL